MESGRHELTDAEVQAIYPDGIGGALVEGLSEHGIDEVRVGRIDNPEQELSEEALAVTDVLVYWAHRAHHEVRDDIVDRLRRRAALGVRAWPPDRQCRRLVRPNRSSKPQSLMIFFALSSDVPNIGLFVILIVTYGL